MKLALVSGGLEIQGMPVELGAIVPWINGRALGSGQWQEGTSTPGSGSFFWKTATVQTFTLYWWRTDRRLEFQFGWHEELSATPLVRLGIRIEKLSGVRAFLRNGYFSWDGSYYITPDSPPAADTVTGFAATQLLAESGRADGITSVVLGFDRHETFQHEFVFAPQAKALALEVLWDEQKRGPAEYKSERLLLLPATNAEAGLRSWAQFIATRAVRAPRLAGSQVKGWCSWYNLYAAISEETVLSHLHSARRVAQEHRLPMEYFQIDDGFTPEMGDWLEVKPQFARGMKALLDDIRAAGFKPGLWIAPFMVGNRSRLYKEHPEWVVREKGSEQPLAQMKFYAEFRWHKRSEEYYILDCTHPSALAYIKEVFRVWREEWGCEYFKTDFMHFGSARGPDTASWHESGLTRMEVWRRMAVTIRESIGEAFWLGCGCPLWASVGLVDGVRIGRDIGVEWKGNYSAQSLLRDQATRGFGNGILWQADPDCILLRDKFHFLTDAELRSLAFYAGMAGGVTMTSDDLGELSPGRIALWREVLRLPPGPCRYPTLGRGEGGVIDPLLLQVKDNGTKSPLIYAFNPTDEPIQRQLRTRDLSPALALHPEPVDDSSAVAAKFALEIDLAPHEGKFYPMT